MDSLLPFEGLINGIWHCDAMDLLAVLPDASIDMILASPPYDNLRTYNGFTWNFEGIARESFRVLKPGGVLVWVVGDATVNGSETLTSFRQALYFVDGCGFNLYDTMIYHKIGESPQRPVVRYGNRFEYMFILSKGIPINTNIICTQSTGKTKTATKRQRSGKMLDKRVNIGGGTIGNVWSFNTGFMHSTLDVEAYQHPAIFPEELALRHIHTWSNSGDIVLDYFSGSGTTAKIARNMERRFIGCDISLEYVELARLRLANTDPYQPTTYKDGTKQLSLFGD